MIRQLYKNENSPVHVIMAMDSRIVLNTSMTNETKYQGVIGDGVNRERQKYNAWRRWKGSKARD